MTMVVTCSELSFFTIYSQTSLYILYNDKIRYNDNLNGPIP